MDANIINANIIGSIIIDSNVIDANFINARVINSNLVNVDIINSNGTNPLQPPQKKVATVPMQKTGVPLNLLAMIVLIVLGSFMMGFRKKQLF